MAYLSCECTPSLIFQESLLIGEIGDPGVDAAPHPGLGQVQGLEVVSVLTEELARGLQYPHLSILLIRVGGQGWVSRLPVFPLKQYHCKGLCVAAPMRAMSGPARSAGRCTDLGAHLCHASKVWNALYGVFLLSSHCDSRSEKLPGARVYDGAACFMRSVHAQTILWNANTGRGISPTRTFACQLSAGYSTSAVVGCKASAGMHCREPARATIGDSYAWLDSWSDL